ncbi:MAG: hypothetical protein ABI723_04905 [Bacteroidia bacterium]
MQQKINIRLIDKIKKPAVGNNVSSKIIRFILYPIYIIIGIIYLFLVMIFGLFQKLVITIIGRNKKESDNNTISNEMQWVTWTKINEILIDRKYMGELSMSGPICFSIKTKPRIIDLENIAFGDWFFPHNNGIFLQKWNSTDKADSDLLFFNAESFKIRTVEKNISSVSWNIVELEDKSLQLNCETDENILIFKIEMTTPLH